MATRRHTDTCEGARDQSSAAPSARPGAGAPRSAATAPSTAATGRLPAPAPTPGRALHEPAAPHSGPASVNVEPFANNGHETALASGDAAEPAPYCRCGAGPHPRLQGRCAEGHTGKDNVFTVTHGGRRPKPLANPEGSELFQAWARDLGGTDNLTAGQRVTLRRVAEADRVCATAFDYLSRTRETLASKRVAAALAVLATHAGTVFRGAALLGLERKSRPVPSVAEYVAERAAASAARQSHPTPPVNDGCATGGVGEGADTLLSSDSTPDLPRAHHAPPLETEHEDLRP